MLQHLCSNISLSAIAGIAHYSPFHFQKLFKEIIGISPKQYIIKLRLETALHQMIIHPQKSIKEISIDCGYSSPAVFTRAINNYFGLPPFVIRRLTAKERMTLYIRKNHGADSVHVSPSPATEKQLIVEIKKVTSLKGIHLIVPSNEPGKIQDAFYQLVQIARSHDLYDAQATMLGIIRPHQTNAYKAFLSIDYPKKIPATIEQTNIEPGKYACFFVKGSPMDTIGTAHQFLQQWLPATNYQLGNTMSFESFSEDPAMIPYTQLNRQFHVPIEPRN
jgi:AraC family transcriptional regulator